MPVISGIEYTEEQNQERIKLVIEIMALAYLFQQKTSHCVFIDYSGHVDSLKIEIRESPENYNAELAECEFYTSGRYQEMNDDPNYWLKIKRDVIKKALDDRELPYEDMQEVAHTVYTNHF